MQIYEARDVFTPGRPARHAFVERAHIQNRVVRALSTPGKQVVVYGHSGSGKSTLISNKLLQLYSDEPVITRCMLSLTYEQAILNAFDQLNGFYVAQRQSAKSNTVKAQLVAEYNAIQSSLSASRSVSETVIENPLLPPQLSPQRLAEFMGEAGRCWVLEDFHKLIPEEKAKLAQVMKIFMDMAEYYPDLKIILLGAVESAREVVQYDPELNDRVAEIEVDLMSDTEIKQILVKGSKLLNVVIPRPVQDEIAQHSNGLAAIAHQLALNMCSSADVYETRRRKMRLTQAEFKEAVKDYLEDVSDTMRAVFDQALRVPRKSKYKNATVILVTLASSPGMNGLPRAELLEKIREVHPEYPPSNLDHYLKKLSGPGGGHILRQNQSSGCYCFSNPFYKAYAVATLSLDAPQHEKNVEIVKNFLGHDLRLDERTISVLLSRWGKGRQWYR